MVVLYAGGKRLGTWAEAERLIAEAVKAGPVELRDATGTVFGRVVSQTTEPICPWEPETTREDLERESAAGGGVSLAEVWKRLGVR